MTLELQHPCAE